MNLAAYLRCSTDRQDQSTTTQRLMLTEWAGRAGHVIVAWYEEAPMSASVPVADRPQAGALFAAVREKRRPFDGICAVRKDRLFRDLLDELGAMRLLEKHRCPLLTPDGAIDRSTPEAEFMSNVMASAAQLERKLTGKRIKDHNTARALQGKNPNGTAPLGLRWNKETKAWETTDRAADVVTLFQTYLDTGGNAAETARRLNAQGLRGATGKPFYNTTVLSLLACHAYRQRVYYAGRVADAPDIPRLVPEALAAQVDVYLATYRPLPSRTKHAANAYCGVLICASCGARLHLAPKHGTAYWRCPSKAKGLCRTMQIAERYLDPLVGRAVMRLLDAYAVQVGVEVPATPPRPPARRRERLTAQRARWAEMYADGLIDRATLQRHVDAIDKELRVIDDETPPPRVAVPDIAAWIARLAAGWPAIPHADRRQLVALLGIVIYVESLPGARRGIELDNGVGIPLISEACVRRVSKRP
ncbi:MAG: recombinase family protein [Armatimonadota bacterium]